MVELYPLEARIPVFRFQFNFAPLPGLAIYQEAEGGRGRQGAAGAGAQFECEIARVTVCECIRVTWLCK